MCSLQNLLDKIYHQKRLGSLPNSPPHLLSQIHPSMALHCHQPVLNICFQPVQSSLAVWQARLHTCNNSQLAEFHDFVHLTGCIQSSLHCMFVEMSPHAFLTSLHLTPVAIVTFLHGPNGLPSVLGPTKLAGQHINTKSCLACIVPFNFVFSLCLAAH